MKFIILTLGVLSLFGCSADYGEAYKGAPIPLPGQAVGTCKAMPADEPQGCVEGTAAVYCDSTESFSSFDFTCYRIDPVGTSPSNYGIFCCTYSSN